ncbi:MAG TPA: RnfABCDGE type electron transport complex subunit B [Syntrophaceae bacterium]|nr:RnfABCDGE type electron transport complex subunit B [Syntrophaceae bacterium]
MVEMLKETVSPMMLMGGMAIVFAIGLGIAARVFYVYVDPKITEVEEVLAGANCGGCGFAGCSDCATAIVEGRAPVDACKPGGIACATAVAQIMGVAVEEKEREVARIMCKGAIGKAVRRFKYMGISDCRAAELALGGDKACSYGCLGLGTCVKNCPFGALSMGEDGLPVVDDKLCTACGTCVRVCPRHIPKLMPISQKVATPCSSHDMPKAMKAVCEVGCTGCGLCKKACPENAVTIDKFLSVVDPVKCNGCGACFEKCPTGIIQHMVFNV